MRRFLIKCVIFATAVLLLAAVLDYILCRGLLKMEDYRFQDYKAMLDGGMDNDILIMGNSRGKSHFNTFIIDSVLNVSSFCIGIGGYPINAQVSKYNIYRSHNNKPRLIIQNIDYSTINIFNSVLHEHQSEQFFPLVYDVQGRKELKKLGYGFLDLNIPLYRFLGYQQVIKNGLLEGLNLKHYISRPAYKGFRAEEGRWNGRVLAAMPTQHVLLSPKGKTVMENYLNRCRADSIPVVLVYSPMFQGGQEKLNDLDSARDYFKKLALEYGCTYLDYLDCSDICKDSSNFCSSVHMNERATKVFTKIFCKDLIDLSIYPANR